MRALRKAASWTAALVLGLPLLLALSVWLLGNLPPGRVLIERAVRFWSAGEVRISGLSGAFPGDLHIARFELRDAGGVSASGRDLQLRWSPLWLLARELRVSQLSARVLTLARAARRTAATAGGSGTNRRLVAALRWIEVDRLQVRQLVLEAPLVPARVVLAVSGHLRLRSLRQGELALSAHQLDARGSSYQVLARLGPGQVSVHAALHEGPGGVLEALFGLPQLGGLSVHASLQGPRTAAKAELAVSAGALHAAVHGTLDWTRRSAALEVMLRAPAMAPSAELAWKRLALSGHWHGPIADATTDAQLVVTGLSLRGGRFAGLELQDGRVDLHGRGGRLALEATLHSLRLPGPDPQLLESSPLQLQATLGLDQPDRPVRVALSHPLIRARLRAHLGRAGSAALSVTLPQLQAFSALLHTHLQGSAQLRAELATRAGQSRLQLSGRMQSRGGSVPARLLAPAATWSASALIGKGREIRIEHATLDSQRLHASLAGADRDGAWSLEWTLGLPDLSTFAPRLAGQLELHGGLSGREPHLALDARGGALLGLRGQRPSPMKLSLRAADLPARPSGALSLTGRLDASPLELALSLEHAASGALRVQVRRGAWKSVRVTGQLALSPAGASSGAVTLRISRLADIDALLGRPLRGSVRARIGLEQAASRPLLRVAVQAPDLELGTWSVRQARLDGTVAAPLRAPSVQLALSAEAASPEAAAQLHVNASGSWPALRWQLLATGAGRAQGAQLAASAQLDPLSRRLTLSTLRLRDHGQTWTLLSPAQILYAGGLRVDRLALAAGAERLTLEGTLLPELDLRASLQRFELAQLRRLLPTAALEGTIAASARLRGTLARPTGEVNIEAQGLATPALRAHGIPAGVLTAQLALQGRSARLQARLDTGRGLQLRARGQLPLAQSGRLAVELSGQAQLNLADPILEASGQRIAGLCALDVHIGGTASAPQISGTLKLTHADFQDYVRGVHWADVTATLQGQGGTLKLEHFTARAGPGTISATGQIGLLQTGVPVELMLRARNADALTSDLLSANVDMDLQLQGRVRGALELAGRIHLNHADVNIPNALPTGVAVLNVRRAGAVPPAPTRVRPIASRLALNLTVSAPRAVFVRGRGLTAELGGQLQIHGSAASPQVRGAFELQSGNFNLAGTTLTFTRGQLSFNGAGLRGELDPRLDFSATSTANGVTATLHVGGYADQPVISLSSAPALPQDEILARLIFGESVTQLTGLQLAQIGAALATMTGVGGSGLDPLATLQRTLGLDRLAISGGSTSVAGRPASNYATIEAGRYVSSRVFVGARQSTAGTTQAQVQIDLTRRLKLQTTLSSGGGSLQGATPQNDPGSSIGLSYQVNY